MGKLKFYKEEFYPDLSVATLLNKERFGVMLRRWRREGFAGSEVSITKSRITRILNEYRLPEGEQSVGEFLREFLDFEQGQMFGFCGPKEFDAIKNIHTRVSHPEWSWTEFEDGKTRFNFRFLDAGELAVNIGRAVCGKDVWIDPFYRHRDGLEISYMPALEVAVTEFLGKHYRPGRKRRKIHVPHV